MFGIRVLIISERRELSVKYKKLIENLNQTALIAKSLSDALNIIQKQEIEFIIISDTINEKLSEFIRKIRVLTFNSRPIIIAVSKSNDLKDRLLVLEQGADDYLGEEISKQEFQMRFKAHLRRYIESFLNPTTNLSDKVITIKAIKKSFEIKSPISYLLIKIRDIAQYQKTHGEIAYEKVLQTLCAIVNSTLSEDDFIGHISDNEFILITNSSKAEKIASFLAFAFDNILAKFYSTDEFENNFTMQSSDETFEKRQKLMRLCISSVEKSEADNDYRDILNNLQELIKLTNLEENSSYIIDRIKLKGEISKQRKKNRVLIYEPDCALSYLLKNVCEMSGIEVELVFNKNEFDELYKTFSPDVVLLDWGSKNETISLNIAKEISKDNIKLIFSSSYLNKKEILKTGADLYVPKPYEIDDMTDWIRGFLR